MQTKIAYGCGPLQAMMRHFWPSCKKCPAYIIMNVNMQSSRQGSILMWSGPVTMAQIAQYNTFGISGWDAIWLLQAYLWPRSGKQERTGQVPSFHPVCGPDDSVAVWQRRPNLGPNNFAVWELGVIFLVYISARKQKSICHKISVPHKKDRTFKRGRDCGIEAQ